MSGYKRVGVVGEDLETGAVGDENSATGEGDGAVGGEHSGLAA